MVVQIFVLGGGAYQKIISDLIPIVFRTFFLQRCLGLCEHVSNQNKHHSEKTRKVPIPSILLLLLLNFFINFAQSANVSISIKTTGAAESNIIDNDDYGLPLDVSLFGDIQIVENLFGDVDFNVAPDGVSATLGSGYVWKWNLRTPPYYWTSPCFWYEIHAKDMSGQVSAPFLEIQRWVTGEGAAAWNEIGEKSTNPDQTFRKWPLFKADNDIHYMYDTNSFNESVNLDCPRIEAYLFLNDKYNGYAISKSKYRVNFFIRVVHRQTKEELALMICRVQVEAQWSDAKSNMVHLNTYLNTGVEFTAQELDPANW